MMLVRRGDLVNGGFDYATNTYTDVELIFVDQTATREDLGAVGDANNAEATTAIRYQQYRFGICN